MSKERIYLSSPHMGGTEQQYVQEAFDSNWIAPLGPNVNAFESQIEGYLGNSSHVAALSSGTAALHLALVQLGVSQGDEVICQSLTFSASANPIMYQGATPVFVDSESKTWNMSPETLEAAIKDRISLGKKPKAVVAVHLYGMPYQVDKIHQIAKDYDIAVVEDSAEALGSTYKNSPCGTFGDFGVLSFNGNKIITTSGGGALVSSEKNVKERTVYLATQARDIAPHYQHSTVGFNYRMSNICAGIGRGQMEVLIQHIAMRRENHKFYKQLFKDSEIRVFEEPSSDYFSNHWLTCIQIPTNLGWKNDDLRLALEAKNIESRPLWKPMHLQPVFREMPYYGEDVAESLFAAGLCLPSGSNLTTNQKERIATVIQEFL